MTYNVIHVQPTPEQRRAFARWAVAQRPKIRTSSTTTFAVPPHLFTEAPENILVGALVDGHRYISPAEDSALGRPAPGTDARDDERPADVAESDGARVAAPGDVLPELPAEPDSIPLPDTSEDSDSSDSADDVEEAAFLCADCDRTFTSERGRDAHRRQKHPEA
ncbi:hypothetical protein [Streptomyces sp. NPDC093108]|uniref:hypothetical protein n=1 Tax=Streptomyces sp. NPDC093108 TaxID=3366030 RepID=UPI003812EB71